MEQGDSSQFVPASLTLLRRTSTGSLSSHKRTASNHSSHSHDYSTCSGYYSMSSCSRKPPITGGSWDDNSVGHGSVAARMRRERNRAIRRTQSNATYTVNPVDTHASITSTLNLINTTALSPWQQDDKLPWDVDYDGPYACEHPTAAAKRSAGSLCNIHFSERHPWDSRSIPEYPRMRTTERSHYRNSFTYAHHHSSPTSGCASMASSEIDSSDLAFFSMTDDSSFFDGDSLFSDSYGVMDADSGFSTNIFSLLEEGAISCRTPFPNGDWPDSISELDFDCSEQQQTDISNCDAHSDIGPSCSAPTDRNKLKKRQVRPQADEEITQESFVDPDIISSATEVFRKHAERATVSDSSAVMTGSMLSVLEEDVSNETENNYILSNHFNSKENINLNVAMQSVYTDVILGTKHTAHLEISTPQVKQQTKVSDVLENIDIVMECEQPSSPLIQVDESEDCDNQTVVNCEINSSVSDTSKFVTNLKEWNSMTKDQKLDFVEQLSERISKTMGLQERMDIIRIIGVKDDPKHIPFHLSIDSIDCNKLSRVLGYLDTHKTVDSPTKLNGSKPNVETNLRRSNSDGNLRKSTSDAQKEHRRRQRQARRFAKWMKQRQKKENRQHMKEQRSGLFINEKKLKIQAVSEDDIEVEVSLS
ncbi:uncharacterized protein LOC143459540 [Clavelina lepadiformis]|uniref:uncharacterized protein LOC143459540 n=1 Tax=Clavelina lepadiformis TaxID=159417 RepID=UPI004041F6F5